jgi:acyl-CoA thioester hydrolase
MSAAQAAPAGYLEGGEFVLPLRIYYEDTDAGGIVYYANYLRFAERGRSEFLRHLGVDQMAMLTRDGLGFAVRRAEIDYRRPARLDDLLEVRTRLVEIGGASVTAEQRVLRAGAPLVSMLVRIACVFLDSGRPGRLPDEVRRLLVPHCSTPDRE